MSGIYKYIRYFTGRPLVHRVHGDHQAEAQASAVYLAFPASIHM